MLPHTLSLFTGNSRWKMLTLIGTLQSETRSFFFPCWSKHAIFCNTWVGLLPQLFHSRCTVTDSLTSCVAVSWPFTSYHIHAGVQCSLYNLTLYNLHSRQSCLLLQLPPPLLHTLYIFLLQFGTVIYGFEAGVSSPRGILKHNHCRFHSKRKI